MDAGRTSCLRVILVENDLATNLVQPTSAGLILWNGVEKRVERRKNGRVLECGGVSLYFSERSAMLLTVELLADTSDAVRIELRLTARLVI